MLLMSEVSTSDALQDALREAGQKAPVVMPRLPARRGQAPSGDETPARPLDEGKIKMRSEHLDVFYGTTRTIKGVDMVVYANEITALIGPSGSGKSTFLRALNRMHESSADGAGARQDPAG